MSNSNAAKDLVDAVRYRNVDSVRALLKDKADVNVVARQSTPLVSAARAGDETILRLLIDAGADLNLGRPSNGASPLFTAASAGNWASFFTLLAAGADPDRANHQGATPLMVVVSKEADESIIALKLLVEKGANVNAACMGGDTVLHHACVRHIPLLLNLGADPTKANAAGHTALQVARTKGDVDIVRLLADAMAKMETVGRRSSSSSSSSSSSGGGGGGSIVGTAAKGQTRKTTPPPATGGAKFTSVPKGVPVPPQRDDRRPELTDTLVHWAGKGSVEQVVQLLEAGANPDGVAREMTPLCAAALAGMSGAVLVLLQAGASTSVHLPSGASPLDCAIRSKEIACVQALVDAGAAVDGAQRGRLTPLMRAASMGFTAAVAALVSAGADVNKALENGMTALMVAAQLQSSETLQVLLQAKADPFPANLAGQTALMIARAVKKDAMIVELLEKAMEGGSDDGGSVEVLEESTRGGDKVDLPAKRKQQQTRRLSGPTGTGEGESQPKKKRRVRHVRGVVAEEVEGQAYFKPSMGKKVAEQRVREGAEKFVVRYSKKAGEFVLVFRDHGKLRQWAVREGRGGWVTVGPLYCTSVEEGLALLNLPPDRAARKVSALREAGAPERMLRDVAKRMDDDATFATWYRGAVELLGTMGEELVRAVARKMRDET